MSPSPKQLPLIGEDGGRVGGKFSRKLNLGQGFLVAAQGIQKRRIPVVGLGIVRIKLNGSAEFLFRVGRGPHSKKSRKCQRGLCFGGLRVQIKCLPRSRESFGISLICVYCG